MEGFIDGKRWKMMFEMEYKGLKVLIEGGLNHTEGGYITLVQFNRGDISH